MTAATRKAAERQRKEAAGLVRVDEWVPAKDVAIIRDCAKELRTAWIAGIDRTPQKCQ